MTDRVFPPLVTATVAGAAARARTLMALSHQTRGVKEGLSDEARAAVDRLYVVLGEAGIDRETAGWAITEWMIRKRPLVECVRRALAGAHEEYRKPQPFYRRTPQSSSPIDGTT